MIIVQLKGGLGNQMFQIALGKKLEYLGKKVKYDINFIESRIHVSNMTKSYDIFDINLDVASVKEIDELADFKCTLFDKIRRKVFGQKKTHYFETKFGEEDKKIYNFNNVYLDGYWQTYIYFEELKSSLINLFKFKKLFDYQNISYEEDILSAENAISLHIRLGDYCNEINSKDFGNICTDEFYNKCIRYFEDNFSNVKFYIFSNDTKYTKRFLNGKKYCVINCNDEKNAWKDMYLMSRCKHNIIANSSFSWWGAWLNNNPNKVVIAPKKWINGREMKNICPSNWLRF